MINMAYDFAYIFMDILYSRYETEVNYKGGYDVMNLRNVYLGVPTEKAFYITVSLNSHYVQITHLDSCFVFYNGCYFFKSET